jgi:uncharacterized DUF497 family protein
VAILWTHHAVVALEKRGLAADEVVAILLDPEWVVTDPKDATLSRAFGKTASGDRWIRVVFRQTNKDDILVITVHPDRDAVPPVKGNE